MNSFHIGINSYQTGMNSYQIGMNLYQTKSIILGWSPIAQSRKDWFKKFFHIHVPKFGPEFWVRLKHPNSRINQYQPGMNLYQIGMNLYQIGMNLYQIGINSYRFRFSYTVWVCLNFLIYWNTHDTWWFIHLELVRYSPLVITNWVKVNLWHFTPQIDTSTLHWFKDGLFSHRSMNLFG